MVLMVMMIMIRVLGDPAQGLMHARQVFQCSATPPA